MSNLRTITYAIHLDEGLIVSRVGRELAWPILDYKAIGEGGDFSKPLKYYLDKLPLESVGREWPRLYWTKKIPVSWKNLHREFWGMKPLPNVLPDIIVPPVEVLEKKQQARLRGGWA